MEATESICMMLSQEEEQRIRFSAVDQVAKLRREYSYVVFYPEAEKKTIASQHWLVRINGQVAEHLHSLGDLTNTWNIPLSGFCPFRPLTIDSFFQMR